MKKVLLSAVAALSLATTTLAQTVPSYVPTNGLVGWWPFNGNANDESGNGNNGNVNGATLTTDRFGNANKAYSFDGIDDYIQTSVQNIPLNNSNRTQSLWVSFYSIPNPGQGYYLLSYGSYTPFSFQGNSIGISNNTTNLTFRYSGYGTAGTYIDYLSQIQTNTWYNIIGVIESGVVKLFINGILVSEADASSWNTIYSTLFIGRLVSIDDFTHAKLDDIGIWNRALTQQEITDLYNAVNCNNNLAITPQNNNVLIGGAATFTATTSDANPTYVWQSDFGQGFQTLNNYGNYSGVNTNALSIANVQLSEHNQAIRAISTSGNCVDTSNVAYIHIADTCVNTVNDTNLITVTDTLLININTVGINQTPVQNTIKVFPNPANTHVTIDYGNFASLNGYQLKIENSLGQQVFQTAINQQSNYLDLSNWGGNGIYFVRLIDPQGNTVDIRKIVLQ